MCKLSLCVLALLGCILASAQAGVLDKIKSNNNGQLHEIAVVKDVHQFAAKHPGLKLQRLFKAPTPRINNQVRYTLGGRVTGDRLVAQASDVFSYPARKDVTVQLTYPESGTGAVVTYVELSCTQDNNNGNAYVVAGGIGQRFISIVVEASQTENFAYQAQYYGSD